jgi:Ni/Co efflux regulator RcnB
MRKLILTALMGATLLPTAAMAQSREEIRHDQRRLHEEQRDLGRAYASGDPRAIREQRDDVRDARRELREDVADRNREWRRDDWRRWRDHDRGLYARGGWRAPFRYTPFRVGARIAPVYYGPSYYIVDPWRYHLPPARFGTRWVRHYDDVILVDVRRGIVLDVIRGFYF